MKIRVPRRLISFILTGVLTSSFACAKDKKVDYKEEKDNQSIEFVEVPSSGEEDVVYIQDNKVEEIIKDNLELYRFVKATTNVNIRSEASSHSDKLGILFKNQVLPLISTIGEWAEVQYDGKIAYINTKYLELIESYEYPYNIDIPAIDSEHNLNSYLGIRNGIKATATVNVRRGPSTEADKLDQLKNGDELPLLSIYDNEWYQVDYNGEIAYVFREYAKETNNYYEKSNLADLVFMISKTPLYDISNMEIIRDLPRNEIVEVFAQYKEYFLVKYNNTFGFVEKSHCQSLGDTYIIIDISSQNLKVFVDDKVIIDTPIVTGKDSTPTYCGIFDVYKKEENVNWPEFNVTVKYGLAFNRGEWIHDANWRKEFGGEIYHQKGSHGCVNIPPETMKDIFDSVEIGTPVLVKK